MVEVRVIAISLALGCLSVGAFATGRDGMAGCEPPANLQTMKAIGDSVRAIYPMDVDPKSPEAVKAADRVMVVDRQNTAQLRPWLERCGWPSVKLHGEEVESMVWSLVQHADQDRRFQKFAIGLLKDQVARKDAPGVHLAYLEDRVAIGMGQRQRYGTQMEQTGPCGVDLLPVDDLALANKRRKEVGLVPLEAYIAQLRATLLPASCRSEERTP